jgi:hypothetical protein
MARREVTGKKPGVSADLINRKSGPPEPDDDEPTQHSEPAAQPTTILPPIRGPPPLLALSILEFCAAFGISEDFFYKLKRQGKAPTLMKVGARTMVSIQAADEWRIERERAAKATNASSAT